MRKNVIRTLVSLCVAVLFLFPVTVFAKASPEGYTSSQTLHTRTIPEETVPLLSESEELLPADPVEMELMLRYYEILTKYFIVSVGIGMVEVFAGLIFLLCTRASRRKRTVDPY